MSEDPNEPFDLDEAPSWVKTGVGIIAFLLIALILSAVAFFVFSLIIKAGLWLLGV